MAGDDGNSGGGAVSPGALSALLRELAAAPPAVVAAEGPRGAGLEPHLHAGAVLVQRFELLRELGQGGFGLVWEAQDRKLGRRVALKFVRPLTVQEFPHERLLAEGEAVARLSHPNIVTLHDVGRSEHGAYLVLELLQGRTLAEWLSEGALPVRGAVHVAAETANGLAHAHAQGVVHRDLKPANVFLCDDGRVKVLDFGLAHFFGQRRVSGGTPAYMAPEQWRGAPEDERTDVFALGLILHQMVAGDLPFPNAHEWLQGSGEVPLLDIPEAPELAVLVRRMLAKDPVERPRDAIEILPALVTLARKLERGGGPNIVSSAAMDDRLRQVRVRWAIEQGLPGVIALADRGLYAEAVALAERIEAIVPTDARLAALWPGMSRLFDVETIPAGAEVHVREYSSPETAWRYLGHSPIQGRRLPLGMYCWKVQKDGFATVVRAHGWMRPVGEMRVALNVRLDDAAIVPAGTVRVDGGMTLAQFPGLDHLPPLRLGEYLIDRTEVTNREFKRFVDAGGYRNDALWKQPFVDGGRPIPRAEAMALFRDRTGRPGPATWQSGDYPDGQGDLPVTGVSWYEAAAFAAFVGKELPTVYQWSHAAGPELSAIVVPQSNFGGKSLAAVANSPGVGPFGTYDMAGNAKEWCWNSSGTERYILGGAWDEPSYMFSDADAQPPLSRAPNFGFRLVKRLDGETDPATYAPLRKEFRDYRKEQPVDRDVADGFIRGYAYERAALDPTIDGVDETSDRWRKEKVSFKAAYGAERIPAYLFTPRHVAPPHQVVIFFPGSNVIYQRSSENLDYMWIVAPIIKSGRALLVPVYKSTYERGDELADDLPKPTAAYREHVVMWARDLGRSIDYVESRHDLDPARVALYGFSWGTQLAPIFLAVEKRIRAAVLVGGGLAMQACAPDADPFNFAPRVSQPVLMVNGRYDFFFPVETSQVPMFQSIGTRTDDKRHVIFEAGHLPPNDLLIKEVLDWFDRYLGTIE